MEQYNQYILILCLVVFILLAGAFTLFITLIIRNAIRLVRFGVEDINIIKEYKLSKSSKHNLSFWGILNKIVAGTLMVALLLMLIMSFFVSYTENKIVGDKPKIKAVYSNSMSYIHESNKALINNGIHNQIQMHDLIVLRKLPKEEEIKLFDVIMYEINGTLVLHRVVGIEEKNEKHPNERYFIFQGDAVPSPDARFVKYSQMRGIYRNERIPFIGSFVHFMNSPAGYICLFFVVAVTLLMPIVDKKLIKQKLKRLIELSCMDKDELYDKLQSIRAVEYKNIPPELFKIIDAPDTTINQKMDNILEYSGEADKTENGKIIKSLNIEANKEQLELKKKVLEFNFKQQQELFQNQIDDIDSIIASKKRDENVKLHKLTEKEQKEKDEIHNLFEESKQKFNNQIERIREKDRIQHEKEVLAQTRRLEQEEEKNKAVYQHIVEIKLNQIKEQQEIAETLQLKELNHKRRKRERLLRRSIKERNRELKKKERIKQRTEQGLEKIKQNINKKEPILLKIDKNLNNAKQQKKPLKSKNKNVGKDALKVKQKQKEEKILQERREAMAKRKNKLNAKKSRQEKTSLQTQNIKKNKTVQNSVNIDKPSTKKILEENKSNKNYSKSAQMFGYAIQSTKKKTKK